MANSISYPNQQIPAYYSGVTINVTSPIMNTAPVHKIYPNCPPEHQAYSVNQSVVDTSVNYATNGHTLPISTNQGYTSTSNNSCTHNPCIPNCPAYYHSDLNGNNEAYGMIPQQNSPNYENIPHQTNQQAIQHPQQIQYVEKPQNNLVDNFNNKSSNVREVISEKEVFTQAESNGLNAISTVSQPQPQNYPAQYYLNNYNYPQYIQASNNDVQPISMNPVQQTTEAEKEEDMTKSKEIISNIDTKIEEQKDLEKNGKSKRVVVLTNEYIMSLENYLNNPNSEIRIMAAKEVLTRLDEDKERFDDAALNALLNKMLQDPEKIVRIAALSALSSQLASGNDYTIELLNNIQKDPNANKEDVLQAANILLQMSADTEIKYTAVPPEQLEVEQQAENVEAQK